ncbi:MULTISPECIES: hypothetical protein [unclassified Thermosynechococcus]|uniref:hypothetical protein n=1 Tax=unclassified Thermosynechococcus TaxID=2622553 RepID=UPI002872E87C|nr:MULTISPECIES: hypothetical protein [unclassified Thermosynechococcus]WNC30187.1 hypothetical protein RHH53_01150 [Thermosynechococcus sp. PKX82]WNC60585.1 hypothetical protein RHJ80_01120 [Thermosynechococcus sp. QS41]
MKDSIKCVPALMSTNCHVLDREEVIRFIPNEDDNSRIIYKHRNTDITYPEEFLKLIFNDARLIPPLVRSCSARVMMLDKTGWHKGRVRLEIVFYPDEENPNINVSDELNINEYLSQS